ncbi:MAG: hypothetical protein IPJ28_10970 [Betaproteobacteria bacterium]|nr:hypothetical protein [Betaproteobacteria bacterium]
MSSSDSLHSTDLAALRSGAALADKLVADGVITVAERDRLLAGIWNEQEADRVARQRRGHAASAILTNHFLEKTMNPKLIVDEIEKTRAVIDAQVRRLSELAPLPAGQAAVLSPELGSKGRVSDLLEESIAGHLAHAGATLRALAEVEHRVRASSTSPMPAEGTAAPDPNDSRVIEGECRKVDEPPEAR